MPTSNPISDTLDGYNPHELRILDAREHVRMRPAMYVGSTGSSGLHHLMFEIVDNSLDEVLAEHANEIWVTLHTDNSVSVRDNGRGIPIGPLGGAGCSGVEFAMTRLNAGRDLTDGQYKVGGGLNGVGLACVNFLSEWNEAVVERDGGAFSLRCERGLPAGALMRTGNSDQHSTKITWLADREIFGDFEYRSDVFHVHLLNRCRLVPGLTIHFLDEKHGSSPMTYQSSRGVAELVEERNCDRDVMSSIIHVEKVRKDRSGSPVRVEIALQFTSSSDADIVSFANLVYTENGGTHHYGFRSGLAETINQYARRTRLLNAQAAHIDPDQASAGVTAVVSVLMSRPQYEGATKSMLGNHEITDLVASITNRAVWDFLTANPDTAQTIIERLLARTMHRVECGEDE